MSDLTPRGVKGSASLGSLSIANQVRDIDNAACKEIELRGKGYGNQTVALILGSEYRSTKSDIDDIWL